MFGNILQSPDNQSYCLNMANENMNNYKPVGALILGLSLILSASIGAWTFYKVKAMDNTLEVTGSAKKSVKSDAVKWSSGFSRVVTIDNLKTGYVQMESDLKTVKKYFQDNGISEDQLDISPVMQSQNYKANDQGPIEYTLQQNITLQSSDIDKITAMAKNTQDLISKDVIFVTNTLEYYYTGLAQARIDLLEDSIKDAKARAEKLAESSGQGVGSLKSASVGSVQVLQTNSTDVSDYGSYDTSTIDKDVMVTVRATFSIK